jgi:hypothetical protein
VRCEQVPTELVGLAIMSISAMQKVWFGGGRVVEPAQRFQEAEFATGPSAVPATPPVPPPPANSYTRTPSQVPSAPPAPTQPLYGAAGADDFDFDSLWLQAEAALPDAF